MMTMQTVSDDDFPNLPLEVLNYTLKSDRQNYMKELCKKQAGAEHGHI